MRLHRLTLRDVKGVQERTVDFPDRGVLVIEGPNEVGKTTMLDAFDALLTLKATSKAAGVRALQPVGRDVAPFVEAELTIGGHRVRYAKQWLRQPATTLHVLEPRPEQLTGDAAQQRLDGLLAQHLDRTLWDALRLTQSGDGTVAPLVSSTVLTAALDAAAGAHQHAEGADALLDRVAQEHALYFTATGRPTGAYREAMTRWTTAQDAVAEAHRRVEEGAALLERQESARARAAQLVADTAEAAETLAAAEEAGARAEAVAATHAAAAERLSHAQELHRAAERSQRERERLLDEHATLATQVAETESARETDLAAVEGLQETLLEAQTRAEQARDAVEDASDEVESARADLDHLADVRGHEELRARLERVGVLAERVREARAALPARQIEQATVRQVRTMQDRLDTMLVEHASTSPSLVVEAEEATVQVRLADDSGDSTVTPHERLRISLIHDATIEIPGQARLRVHLQQEALGRVAELGRLRAEFRAILTELTCSDVVDVERMAEATEDARGALREATRDLEALVGSWRADLVAQAAGGVVPEELTQEVEAAEARVAATLAARPLERPLPEDEPAARALVDEASARLRTARTFEREALAALTAAQREVAALTNRLDRAAGLVEAQRARMQALQAQVALAREELPDQALADLVAEHSGLVEAATEGVREATEALSAVDVPGARATLESARHQHRLRSEARDQALAETHQLAGQVEMAAGEGRAELHDLALADLEDAERDLRAVDRRARAARHLFTTLNRHRDAAHRAYVRPYTQALEHLGRRVYGDDFAVTVDEDLALSARTLDGTTVPFAELSGGAKEQLGILARLAVARLVDPTQGVPVVIDDALGYSDPERLRQMGQVLGSTTEGEADVQVILLTCTPERYAAIPHVSTVRLTA